MEARQIQPILNSAIIPADSSSGKLLKPKAVFLNTRNFPESAYRYPFGTTTIQLHTGGPGIRMAEQGLSIYSLILVQPA